MEALQGPIATIGAGIHPRTGFRGRAQDALHQVLAKAQARVRAVFEEITVADLAATGVSAPLESR